MQTATIEPRVTVIPPKAKADIKKSLRQRNVAAYCRVSTDEEEQESSYEAQVSYYTDKIRKNPEWSMVGIFADEGISGTQAQKRPEFLRMINLCRKKKIDLILTKSVSRFARNTVDTLKYVRELKNFGIGVIFEKENIDTLLVENEMLLTIMSCFAQAESESISKNVSWGIRQSFKNGNVPMRYSMLLGYTKGEDGKPQIVPEEAETVKEIYRRYLDGFSYKQIADFLNERKIYTKFGNKPWSSGNIKNILQNEKYTGDALLQKTYITDCISKKSRKNNGELPMYLVQNHHKAIISHADFNKVQEEIARRNSKRAIAEKLTKTENSKYSAKFALTELLICGECGTHYRRVTWTAKGFKEIKWRCINRLQYGKKYCKNSPTVDETALHKAIVTAINAFCEGKGEIAEVLKDSIRETLDPNLNGSILAAQQRIEELSRNINELIKLATVPENAQTAMSDIQKFSDEMKSLRSFIEAERAKQATAESNTEQLETVLASLENHDFNLNEFDDVVVRHLIECVKVMGKDTITVIFKGGAEIQQSL